MKDYQLLIRASSGSDFMTNDRSGKAMGETAKSMIKKIAIEDVFGLRSSISSREMEKGTWLEEDAIAMLNRLEFKSYEKNTERKTSNGFTGECDIYSPNESLIRDIKNAWSADTFSWTKDELEAKVKKSGYDTQGRIYMMLWDCDFFKLDEVLLSTPVDLLGYNDSPEFHDYDAIPENKRITTIEFNRDKLFEERLQERYHEANNYYQSYINQLLNK